MEVYAINARRETVGGFTVAGLDLSQGESNTFSILMLDAGQRLERGWFVDVPGTEFGGVVRSVSSELSDGLHMVRCSGTTWTGILNEHVVMPPASGGNYRMEGEANDAVRSLVASLGLSGLFSVSEEDSGIELSKSLARFCLGLDGARSALQPAGARLSCVYDHLAKRPVLSVVKAKNAAGRVHSTDTDEVSVTLDTPVNHLVCAGEGEGGERAIVHLYADAKGNVSKTRTFSGVQEVAQPYLYTSADLTELEAEGRTQLAEMQVPESLAMTLSESSSGLYGLDDWLRGYDALTGAVVRGRVSSKVLQVGLDGVASVTLETDPATIRRM